MEEMERAKKGNDGKKCLGKRENEDDEGRPIMEARKLEMKGQEKSEGVEKVEEKKWEMMKLVGVWVGRPEPFPSHGLEGVWVGTRGQRLHSLSPGG